MINTYTDNTWDDGDGLGSPYQLAAADAWLPRQEDLTGEGRSTRYW